MEEETNLETRENMLDYVIVLMDDANDFSCDIAMASHAILLCRMEQEEIKHYGQTETKRLTGYTELLLRGTSIPSKIIKIQKKMEKCQ